MVQLDLFPPSHAESLEEMRGEFDKTRRALFARIHELERQLKTVDTHVSDLTIVVAKLENIS